MTGVELSGLRPVCISGKWGCEDEDGELVIPAEYDNVLICPDAVLVEKDDLLGAVDFCGLELLPAIYRRVVPIGVEAFICREPGGGWQFLHYGRKVFSDVNTIWCYEDGSPETGKRVYMLLRKGKTWALGCQDGRMFSDFTLTDREAGRLADKLLGRHIVFELWLSRHN